MPPDPLVLALVAQRVERLGIPASLGFCVVWAESEFDTEAAGDGGLAHGALQVRIDVHGQTREYWTGIVGLERSFDLMGDRWQRAWAAMGAAAFRWLSDPVGFLREFWHRAQGADQRVVNQRAATVVREGLKAYEAWAGTEQPSMVEKPPVQWFPADERNVESRDPNVAYEAIVLHTTAGQRTVADLGRWFGGENLAQGLRGSTHFGVDLDGNIGRYVSLNRRAIAHGDEAGATARLAKENRALGHTANDWAIGIEHLDDNRPGQWTRVQLEASARLAAWLWQTEIAPHAAVTGAVLDREHILGHYELAPSSKPFCPSRSPAQFQEYVEMVAAFLAEPETGPGPDPDPLLLAYRDALTVQARANRETAAAMLIQAENLEALVRKSA